MDLAFLRRAERMLAGRQPARLDHSMLCATLASQRSANTGAPPTGPYLAPSDEDLEDEPMIELLLAGPGWREALSAQRGCFSRAEAGRRINAS